MSKVVIVILAVVAVSSLAQGSRGAKCMKPWGKMNFEHEKFAGEWFVVGKIASATMPKVASSCCKVTVETKQNGNVTEMDSHLSMKVDDAEVKMTSKSQSMCSKSPSVMLGTWKKEGDEKYSDIFMQSILATDYTDFAVMYACRPIYIEESNIFDKLSVLHLLSRKPEMEATMLSVLKNIIGGLDFEVPEMIMIDNSKC